MNLSIVLDTLDFVEITQATFLAGTFDEEYKLPCDDKDYVTFHKKDVTPFICDKLLVCNYETTTSPIYKDWWMSINYHS